MIRILVLSFTIVGFGAYLQASPVSGTGAGMFNSALEGSAGSMVAADLSFCSAHVRANLAFDPPEEHAPEFRTASLTPEVVRIVLMGSGLICLAALWQRRENRRLRRFV